MGNERAVGIHVVMAAKDGKVEYWAAAVRQSRALEAVRQHIAPGWRLILTQHRLRPALAEELKMRTNSVRQLPPDFTPSSIPSARAT
jgi:hypothetical protein